MSFVFFKLILCLFLEHNRNFIILYNCAMEIQMHFTKSSLKELTKCLLNKLHKIDEIGLYCCFYQEKHIHCETYAILHRFYIF